MASNPLKLWYAGSYYPTTNTDAGMLGSTEFIKVTSTPNNSSSDFSYGSTYVDFTFRKTYTGTVSFLRRLSNAIYLNAYSTLTITVTTSATSGETSRLGFSSSGSMTGNSFNAATTFSANITKGIYTINISSLTGGYYMYLLQYASGWERSDDWGSYTTSCKIYEMTLT